MKTIRRYAPWLLVAGFAAAAACSGGTNGSQIGSGATGTGANAGTGAGIIIGAGAGLGTGGAGGAAPTHPCTNLECQQTTCTLGSCAVPACTGGGTTTVSGTVYDPAGKVPIYNVVVWVPNGAVPPITSGASCDRCDASIANPVATALTDTHGHFSITDVPVGQNIPLVIQVGKWRRQITLPNVTACVDTPITDINQTRLPRNKAEGDIPLIALTTGGADSMECLPRRMGLDDAEFTTGAGNGRIHLYAGTDSNNNTRVTRAFAANLNGGAAFTASTALWGTTASLSRYDIVILSCEGALLPASKPPASRQALYAYESLGGRVFTSHWHHLWFSGGPAPVPTVGTWDDLNDPQSPAVGTINTTFPKGQALSEWLVNVGASATPGQLQIVEARDNLQAVNTAANMGTEWITVQNNNPGGGNNTPRNAVQYMSYNAPLAVDPTMQCGRAVYTDLHVSATGDDITGNGNTLFPEGCAVRDLSPQEKAVEFMLFDLSSCIQSDSVPPVPPIVPK